ncbi:MAG TPA: BTAD domain-containing putative transcriptional regulator [Gaiellaceae bacterium]|nr:BTAD domain-containing putative transcriptional regulator [Gaiellaceae bacterium]
MEFRLLGPLEVAAGGATVPLGGPRQRALLALLLIHRNEAVPAERILDALWEREPPRTAAQVVRVYVSHLRKLVGPEALATVGNGYVLRVADEELDSACFEAMTARARALLEAGDAAAAVAAFDEALALWRGDPLPEVAYDDFARPEIARLVELRLTTVEDRHDAALAAGRGAELVASLEHLVASHPLRERLRAQLMLALYRAGRQADALNAYQEGRRALVDELGIEPGDTLRRLEGRILQQDPALIREIASPRPAQAGAPRRREAVVVAVAALVVAGATGTYVLLRGNGGGPETARPVAGRALRVAAINPIPKPAPTDEDPVVAEPIAGMREAAARLGMATHVYWEDARHPAPPAEAWADLIVVGAAPNLDGVAAAARAHPRVRYLVPESVTASWSPFRGLRNVTGVVFDDRQLGYLAGALAALMVKPHSAVSAVGGIAVPSVQNLIAGFTAGARSIRPRIRVLLGYSHTFLGQQRCEEVANDQVDHGSSVVFDVAGSCGYGAMQAAGIRGVWGIGVDSDLSYLGPQILASAVKRLDRATALGVTLFANGSLPAGGDLRLDLANDAIGLVGISDRVPGRVRARLEAVAARLRAHPRG